MKRFLPCALALALAVFTAQAQSTPEGIPAKGIAVLSENKDFGILEFTRRPLADDDILIEVEYASICHSDIHRSMGDWGETRFPLVPGHEVVGKVTQVGKNVRKFKVGDIAGVGAIVGSCRACDTCLRGEEQYCKQKVLTFHGIDFFHGNVSTQGGFSDKLVVSEHYAIRIPEGADLARVSPLLCAGITVYAPLRFTHVRAGDKVAVAGFGGLGHLAVKYAVDMGADVTVFDLSEEKRSAALAMGAKTFVNVSHPEELQGMDNAFRVIINTITKAYDPVMYLNMLQMDGDFVIVGIPSLADCPSLDLAIPARLGRKKIYGSQMGGIQETQAMIDYSVAHNIYPDVTLIPATPQAVEEAYKNVVDGKVLFRYVIDMKTLR